MMHQPLYAFAAGPKPLYPLGPALSGWIARVAARPAWQTTEKYLKAQLDAQRKEIQAQAKASL